MHFVQEISLKLLLDGNSYLNFQFLRFTEYEVNVSCTKRPKYLSDTRFTLGT